jgi:hypothetical protein
MELPLDIAKRLFRELADVDDTTSLRSRNHKNPSLSPDFRGYQFRA